MHRFLAAFSFAALSFAQTVSVDQLAHKVPSTAAREYAASANALSKGDLNRSIEHCLRAIEVDPGNASAHNDLGVLYLNAGRAENALAEFERAISLQPRLKPALLNTSFTLLALGRAQDSEKLARAAIEISSTDRRAHLLLGWSLVNQLQYSRDALSSLRIAEREFPEAYLAAADVLMHQGSLDAARTEVQAYLASGSTEHKSLAETWLRMLTLE